jgi:hypothetical protein
VGKSRKSEDTEVPYLSWNTLREMADNKVTIGAFEDHSLYLHGVPEDLLKKHIVDHKKMLEDELGTEIRYCGVKEGIPDRAIRKLVASQGYRAFLTEYPDLPKAQPRLGGKNSGG